MSDLSRAEYDALPESVRANISYLEYQWLSERDKGRLIETETEPDQYDD